MPDNPDTSEREPRSGPLDVTDPATSEPHFRGDVLSVGGVVGAEQNRMSRRTFIRIAGGTVAALVLGGAPTQEKRDSSWGVETQGVTIPVELAIDPMLKETGQISEVIYNPAFVLPGKRLNDALLLAEYEGWKRTRRVKTSLKDYLRLVKQAQASGNSDAIHFSVGGTDKSKSEANNSVLSVSPLDRVRIVVVNKGAVYDHMVMGMGMDNVWTDYAPDDTYGQSRITEVDHERFGFARETDGTFILMFNWDPLKGPNVETQSAQLTERLVSALVLMGNRNPDYHNYAFHPHPEFQELLNLVKQKGRSYESLLFTTDSGGHRVGLLSAPEFTK